MVIILSALIFSSCKSKETPLVHIPAISKIAVRSDTETPAAVTQNFATITSTSVQELPPDQSNTTVYTATSTSTALPATQRPSSTSVSAQVSTSYPVAQTNTSTAVPGTSTQAPTQTRTLTPTPTRTVSAPSTETATPSKTITPTHTATQTLTPTLQIGWEGEWVTYFERLDGSIGVGTLEFTLQGTDMTAVMSLDNLDYLFDGIVFNDGKYATGSWSSPDGQGNFWWNLQENGQFRGCHENHYAFCGSRAGIDQPSPCLELPSR